MKQHCLDAQHLTLAVASSAQPIQSRRVLCGLFRLHLSETTYRSDAWWDCCRPLEPVAASAVLIVAPCCRVAAERLHRGAAPLPLPPVLLVAAVAVMRLRRVVEEGEDISGRSPRDERWASADSLCVPNSLATAT